MKDNTQRILFKYELNKRRVMFITFWISIKLENLEIKSCLELFN